MAVTSTPGARAAADAQQRIAGPALHLLCGLCFLFVAMGFSYLDRAFGRFEVEVALWLAWAALGFGAGAFGLRRPGDSRPRLAWWLTVFAGLLVFVPGLLLYALPRWPAFAVLLMVPARAAAMQRRKDVYLCLVSIVAVSLLVATHSLADWTLWFYLAPAWVLAALVLAWDYAASVRLGPLTKVAMTLGFLVAAVATAVALWAVLPQPGVENFGFVPAEAGAGKRKPADASTKVSGEGAVVTGGASGPNDAALARLQKSLQDPNMPRLQRLLLESVVRVWGQLRPEDAGGVTTLLATWTAADVERALAWLLALLALLLTGWLAYRSRWRIAIEAALALARVTARRRPGFALRCVQVCARMALHRAGHRIQPGQSVREHVRSAPGLPAPAMRWLRQATDAYCACRFGQVRATPGLVNDMRAAVVAALEVIDGRVPATKGRA